MRRHPSMPDKRHIQRHSDKTSNWDGNISNKMVKTRKYIVNKYFHGLPKRDDFEIVDTELPPIKDGEILVKAEWISVDPYQRALNSSKPIPYDQFGMQVGIVEDSKNRSFPVGTRLVCYKGWCEYCIFNPQDETGLEKPYVLSTLKGLSESHAIGAVGAVGASAYFGLLEICRPKYGETVVVTGAAGAVGSIVGQIAKIKGCRVIGFAGSDDKVKWLKELGFDEAFNYNTVDAHKALKAAAPQGIDCYFDNVGGELSSVIINQMKQYGRVSVCGSISSYNGVSSELPKSSILQPAIVSKQLKIEGFLAYQWLDRWPEAFVELIEWIKSGELQPKEHVTEGFDNIYDAFVGMLTGENFGKAIVKVC